tara:strand:+ start:445 stop:648 length:204 start_codon:yes stop_codon:yes gene_type:complete
MLGMGTTLYKITGNTYRNRFLLRSMAAEWKPEKKAWFINLGGNGSTDTVWALRRDGCKVVEADRHSD